jgi:hypothetical protein
MDRVAPVIQRLRVRRRNAAFVTHSYSTLAILSRQEGEVSRTRDEIC